LILIDLGELKDVGLSRASIGGREVLIARLGNQELLLGEKINPVPVPEKWLKRVGDYEIVNPEGDFLLFDHIRLAYEEGFLLFQGSGTLQAGAGPLPSSPGHRRPGGPVRAGPGFGRNLLLNLNGRFRENHLITLL